MQIFQIDDGRIWIKKWGSPCIRTNCCKYMYVLLIVLSIMLLEACATTTQYSYSSNELLLYPERQHTRSPGRMREVFISTLTNLQLHGFLYEDGDVSKPVFLYLHGNGDTVWSDGMYQWYERVIEHGYRVLALDYQGYGLSEGRATVAELVADAEAGYSYLSHAYPQAEILIWGRSLGTIPAILLGHHYPTAPVVLEGTISNLPDLEAPLEQAFSRGVNTVDLQIVDDQSFDNARAIQTLHNPTLMIHGDRDRLALFSIAQRLYETLSAQTKQFHVLKGEGHTYRSSKTVDEILTEITHFLKRAKR